MIKIFLLMRGRTLVRWVVKKRKSSSVTWNKCNLHLSMVKTFESFRKSVTWSIVTVFLTGRSECIIWWSIQILKNWMTWPMKVMPMPGIWWSHSTKGTTLARRSISYQGTNHSPIHIVQTAFDSTKVTTLARIVWLLNYPKLKPHQLTYNCYVCLWVLTELDNHYDPSVISLGNFEHYFWVTKSTNYTHMYRILKRARTSLIFKNTNKIEYMNNWLEIKEEYYAGDVPLAYFSVSKCLPSWLVVLCFNFFASLQTVLMCFSCSVQWIKEAWLKEH